MAVLDENNMVTFVFKIIKKQAHRLVLLLADWLFPKECVGCSAEGRWLCADCRGHLTVELWQVCLVCGQVSGGKICAAHYFALDGLLAALDYKNTLIKDLIKVAKYNFSREATEELSELLVEFCQKNNWRWSSDYVVMAVPLSRRRQRWRGFNQAAIMAKRVAEFYKLPYSASLFKIRHTDPQVALSAQARLGNLVDCFAWRGDSLSGSKVLLIDDVSTTGSTLNECAKVLKQAGAEQVWALVCAK